MSSKPAGFPLANITLIFFLHNSNIDAILSANKNGHKPARYFISQVYSFSF